MTTTLRRPFSFRLNPRSRQCALTWEFSATDDKNQTERSLYPRIDGFGARHRVDRGGAGHGGGRGASRRGGADRRRGGLGASAGRLHLLRHRRGY